MKITYFHRNPQIGGHSLERVFAAVRKAMPADIEYKVAACRYYGTKPDRLLYNMLEARNRQGDVNHITGDIHYVANLLDPKKTILTIPDCVGLHNIKGVKQKIFKMLWYDIPVRRSRLITTISNFTAAELCKYVSHATGKTRVVYVPVSEDFTYHPKLFNAKSPLILQIGTGKHNKNLARITKAIKGISCRLDIVGKLEDDQKKLLYECNTDYTNSFNLTDAQILQKYKNCDMVMFASTYEGFGMPIIEAQATGRPVITGNVCSMPEVAGNGACIVNPYDVQSIRTGILRVIQDSDYRQMLIENGLKNVQRFNVKNIALQYLRLYKKISGY